MASKPIPLRSISPGRADSMMKSAFSARENKAVRPASVSKSRQMLRLLRLNAKYWRLRSASGPSSKNGPIDRLEEPPGGSTFMTSAPRSPRIILANSPWSAVRSKTVYGLSMFGNPKSKSADYSTAQVRQRRRFSLLYSEGPGYHGHVILYPASLVNRLVNRLVNHLV